MLLAPLLFLFFCSRHLDHHQVGGRATHVQSFNELKRSIPHHLSAAHTFRFAQLSSLDAEIITSRSRTHPESAAPASALYASFFLLRFFFPHIVIARRVVIISCRLLACALFTRFDLVSRLQILPFFRIMTTAPLAIDASSCTLN